MPTASDNAAVRPIEVHGAHPDGAAAGEGQDAWRERLDLMDDWYRELLAGGYESAEAELLYWFEPHAPFFAGLKGSLVDLGGGVGLFARYLPPDCAYTVVDPNDSWKAPEWLDFAHRFTGGREPRHVNAMGENLPFADDSFDNGMAYSSLNHVSHADLCVAELARVVRKGGTILLVMEDMEPSWADVLQEAVRRTARRLTGRRRLQIPWHNAQVIGLLQTVRCKLSRSPWPSDEDHTLIPESDMRRWFSPRLKLVRREWCGRLLTFELVRVA